MSNGSRYKINLDSVNLEKVPGLWTDFKSYISLVPTLPV